MVGENAELYAERCLLMSQVLCPPLPMISLGHASGEERVANSHTLLWSIMGRLLALPNRGFDMLKGAYEGEGFDGNWPAHAIGGRHAMALLEALSSGKEIDDRGIYTLFCSYMRDLISILVGYDMCAGGRNPSTLKALEVQDIRFLHDMERVSFTKSPGLVIESIDFYCSILITRCGRDGVEEEKQALLAQRDYATTTLRCMRAIQSVAGALLGGEDGRKGTKEHQ